jgi:hypothetical protein
MPADNVLTNLESIHSNQNGQITPEQRRAIRSKLGDMPGWFTVGLLFALLIGTALLGKNILTRSTPLAIIAVILVIIVTFVITSFLGNLLGGLRMTNLKVEQVRGQVAWYTNRYAAVANGRLLELITNSNIQPGDYTFTVLRGTKYVISAQRAVSGPAASSSNPAAPGSGSVVPADLNSLKAFLDKPLDFDPKLEPEQAARHVAMLTQALQNLEGSDPSGVTQQDALEIRSRLIDQVKQLTHGQSIRNLIGVAKEAVQLTKPQIDSQEAAQLSVALEQVGIRNTKTLSANQAGKQSAGQRGQLVKDISSNLLWSGITGLGWFILSAYAVTHAEWKPFLAATGLFLVILLMLLTNARKELRDLLSGSVEVEEGWVSKFTRNSHSSRTSRTYHYYKLNGNSYEVWQRAYDALIEGNYRIYFMPNTRRIVNIDPVATS